ncbi:MAG: hypothetical protein WC742_09480 [Gallionellaceae bacterium]|jgi:hypothetical protein
MYLPELLNSEGLFQKMYAWKKISSSEEISALLYRASSCVIHMRQIAELDQRCVLEFGLFENQLELGDAKIVFHSTSLLALLNEISPLLSSLRIMQDMLLPLIGKKIGRSMPSSLNDGMNKIHSLKIPTEIEGILLRYWQTGGSRLRDYRVIDQHHANLVNHTFLQISPQKKVLVLFPDNPQSKSPKLFVYKESINGIDLLRTGFEMLHAVYEDVANAFGFKSILIENEIGMAQHGDLLPARPRTLAFWYEANQSVSENEVKIYISGLEIRQTDEGRIALQRMFLGEDKLLDANLMYGSKLPNSAR